MITRNYPSCAELGQAQPQLVLYPNKNFSTWSRKPKISGIQKNTQ